MLDRVKKHDDLLIMNDEAHHVHDTDLEWYKVILNLQKNLKEKFGKTLSLQLDFSATPKDQNGTFFPWIINDYTLAQAIEDRIVKAPLIVHQTDKAGEVSKKDLDVARDSAKSIDLPGNKIRAIISVLMLREGWDVRNVSVILGLRPFTAKANILPEQAVGRGLRLMRNIGPDYIQIVEIIGTQKFEEFVKGLEVEGVGVGVTREPPPLGIHIYPVKIKSQYDIEIPILTPSYDREFKGLSDSILKDLPKNPKGLSLSTTATKVTLVETVTQKTMAQKQVTIDTGLPEINEILTHLTNRISKEARIDGQFVTIYPIVRKYVKEIFFGQEVNLEDEKIRRLLTDARNVAEIITTLSKVIGDKSITRAISQLKSEPLRLSELDGFYWRRDWVELERTIFNITPCFNDFEKHFAQFLDHAKDISKFTKLAETFTKFSLEYLNHKSAISYYYPDFVSEQETSNGDKIMWLIETKGWEQADVQYKDARAKEWCKDATELTKTKWQYLKVKHSDYISLTDNLSKLPANLFKEFLMKLDTYNSPTQLKLNRVG